MLPLLDKALAQPDGAPLRYPTTQGPAVFFQRPDHVAAVLAHPGLERASCPLTFGDGLVVSKDTPDSLRRRILQRQFGKAFVERFMRHVEEVFFEHLESWDDQPRDVELNRLLRRMTLEAASRSALGVTLGDQLDEVAHAITLGIETLGRIAKIPLQEACHLPPNFSAEVRQAQETFDRFLYPLIARRRAESPPGVDILSALCQSELSDLQVRDEAVSLLLAGNEAPAVTLEWSQIELALRPDLLQRLRDEAAQLPRPVEVESVSALTVAKAVAEETMRLYPAVWQLSRVALRDLEIGEEKVAAGTLVVVSPYTVQRDSANWPDPERFDPERFMGPDVSRGRNFVPFSGGLHVCLGRRPGTLEVTLLLALLARYVEIDLDPGPYLPSSGLTLRPAAPLKATVRRR